MTRYAGSHRPPPGHGGAQMRGTTALSPARKKQVTVVSLRTDVRTSSSQARSDCPAGVSVEEWASSCKSNRSVLSRVVHREHRKLLTFAFCSPGIVPSSKNASIWDNVHVVASFGAISGICRQNASCVTWLAFNSYINTHAFSSSNSAISCSWGVGIASNTTLCRSGRKQMA